MEIQNLATHSDITIEDIESIQAAAKFDVWMQAGTSVCPFKHGSVKAQVWVDAHSNALNEINV